MRRIVMAGLLLFAVAATGLAQKSPTAPRKGGNPDAANIKSAVPSSADSVAAGRRLYTRWCANCHGPSGQGDGAGAAAGGQPSDLTDATWDYGSSEGEIFSVIHDGTSTDMGSYAERMTDTDIWNLVNFVRSLGKTEK